MKLFLITLILSLLAGSLAGIFGGYYHDKAHPGKCVYRGVVLSPGDEHFPKGECKRFLCMRGDGLGNTDECGVQLVGPPCKLGDYVEPNRLYPDCCERKIICPKKRMIIPDNIDKEAVPYSK